MKLRIFDIETGDDQNSIVEIGYWDLVAHGKDLLGAPNDWDVQGFGWSTYVDPGRIIEPEYSAVHHIVDADVRGSPAWHEIAAALFSDEALQDVVAFGAHGVKYEWQFLGPALAGLKPWVCSYKAALKFWPEAPSHSNQALRYWRNQPGLSREFASPPHRAKPDAYVTAHHLKDFLADHSLTDLVKITGEPSLLPRCKIGKWRNEQNPKGTPWEDVDDGFMHWVLGKDFDEDVKFTIRHHLAQREIDRRLAAERAELERQFSQQPEPSP